jgi:hypothetical protein
MSDIAIKAENLSRLWRTGASQEHLNAVRERIEKLLPSPFDYVSSTLRRPSEEETVCTDEGLTCPLIGYPFMPVYYCTHLIGQSIVEEEIWKTY